MDLSLLNQLMSKTSVIEPATFKEEYGVCCGEKMEVRDSRLVCQKCRAIKKYLGEYGNKPESQKAQYNSYGGVLPGSNTLKTDEEKIRTIVAEFQQKIRYNKYLWDDQIMRTAAELMFQFSKGNTKKSQNRNQLFGACLYYSSIRHKNILMNHQIANMLNLTVRGISTGVNIMIKYALRNKIPFEFDPPIHGLLIKHYLKIIPFETTLNTKENRRFCKELVEAINNLGLCYDKGIQIKCSGAVYYLLYYKDISDRYNNKDLSALFKFSQNSYIFIFNVLIKKKYNMMLPDRFQLHYD